MPIPAALVTPHPFISPRDDGGPGIPAGASVLDATRWLGYLIEISLPVQLRELPATSVTLPVSVQVRPDAPV